jgi:alpha-tubulin suppressor-like RCC1 family protein
MRVVSNKQKIVALAIVLTMAATLIVGTFAQVASGAPVSTQSITADTEQIQVAAGDAFTCALLNDGTVKCWGYNNVGQLGRDNTANVGGAAGDMAALTAITLGVGRTATAITAGREHACALLDNGLVKCWGRNAFGALGQGSTTNAGDGAGTLMSALPVIDLGPAVTVRAIEAGNQFTCALLSGGLSEGKVKCWGDNSHGQLGQGDTDHRGDNANEMGANLGAIDFGVNKTAIALAVADASVCAILNLGEVKCWGFNGGGELGQGNTTKLGDGGTPSIANAPAVDLGVGKTATAIAAGTNHFCAILNDNTVKCWGNNGQGQLGVGDTANRGDDANEMGDNLLAVDLGVGLTARAIAAGGSSTCALLSDNSLKCWGDNAQGQLGLGDTDNRGNGPNQMGTNLPAINLGTGKAAVSMSVGNANACAVLNDVSVKCWGNNTLGQLGLGNTGALNAPSANAIVVDTTAPSITTTSPNASSPTRTPTPTYTGLCESRIPVAVNVYANASATGTALQTLNGSCVNGAYAITATQPLDNNAYTFVVSQTDAAGNIGRTLPVTYTLAATLWSTPPASDVNTRIRGTFVTPIQPGSVYVTKDFGFTMDNTRGLKPRIRMKDYSGVVRLTLTANYVRAGKIQTYRCTYAPFGNIQKRAKAKWRWTISPRRCVLPVALRDQLLAGTTTLRAKGTVTRYWSTTGLRTRPDGSSITTRRINVVLRNG